VSHADDLGSSPDQAPRTGMSAADSVKAVVSFISASGRKYRIIKTRELDAYDKLPPIEVVSLQKCARQCHEGKLPGFIVHEDWLAMGT